MSAAAAWEIAIKSASGKLRAPDDLQGQMASNGFLELPVLTAHASAAGRLPRHHTDLFDRMLIAQAQIESLTLLTNDRMLKAYDERIMLA